MSPVLRRLLPVFASVFAGCAETPGEFHEVARVDEAIGEPQLATLERIAAEIDGGRLPAMAPHFLAAPQWTSDRPAGVASLAEEELARLRKTVRLSTLADSLRHETRLKHVLKREGLTTDQYAALVLACGLATQRSRVDAARDLEQYVRVGREEMKRLKGQTRSFASLTPQERADAVERATWITRVNRAERLLAVPEANAVFADAERIRFEAILPKAFLREPLAAISVPLLDRGVPFREQSETGYDAELTWTRTDERAVLGGKSVAKSEEDEWR